MKTTQLTLRILLLLCLFAPVAAFGHLVPPLLAGGGHTGRELLPRQSIALHHVTLTLPQATTPHHRDSTNDIKHDLAVFISISIGILLLAGMLFGLFYFLLERPKPEFKLKWEGESAQHTHKYNLVFLLSVLSIAIFTTEFIIMLILPTGLTAVWTAILDASLLILILLPLLYFLLIHPYFWQYHLRQRAETGNLLLANILDHANNEIYIFDTSRFRFMDVSQGACDNLGYSRAELSQMCSLDLKVDYTLDQYRVLVDPLLTGEKSQVTYETRHQRKDGTFYPVEVHLQLFDNISPPIFVAITEDISERKRYIAELEHKALYDSLTELPNRSLLMDRLAYAIKISRRNSAPLSVLLIDIMRLQEINDIMGHADGDLVLQQVARRLTLVLRESDTIARIGGDEFVIVLPNTKYEHLGGIAKKLLSAFEELIHIREMPLEVELAIGIACYPDHGDNPTTLLQHADVAMRISKRETSGFYLYTPEDDPFSVRHLQLHAELRHAIMEKSLTLYYQPQLDVASGEIISVEALARWPQPDGVISPNDFIPMVERTGLIRPYTQWLLEEAFKQCQQWRQHDIKLSIAVNLSTRNLLDPELATLLEDLLKTYNIDPAWLTLEITESALMSRAEKSLKLLTKLSAQGFRFSIDDFGTGYSSLAYLKRMPVNELKIDRSFISTMCNNESDTLIVQSTIDLAHHLGLKVVAEGIEERQQLDRLIEFGIDIGQGFYISEPLSVQQLGNLLANMPRQISHT